MASTVAVALAVPQFAYVTALGGALFGLTVCVCIPALAFLKITWGCAAGSMHESSSWRCSCLMPSSAACKLQTQVMIMLGALEPLDCSVI